MCGLGPHAVRNILPAVHGADAVELHGVCSRNPEVVAAAVARYGCKGWIDFGHMLGDRDVDAVCLATPTGLHALHGIAVLEAGKHLWCEKPLATNLADSVVLCRLAEERSLGLAEGFMYLHHPQFTHVREVLEFGRIGCAHTLTIRLGIPTLAKPGFRNDPSLGGGALLDVGCYPVSAALGLFPDEKPRVMYAVMSQQDGSAVDTAGKAVLEYAGGMSAILEWGTGVAYRNEIDVWGSSGSISSDRFFSKPADHPPRLRMRDIHGRETEEDLPAANHFVRMFAAFRDIVLDDSKAAMERSMILRRASMLQSIRVASSR